MCVFICLQQSCSFHPCFEDIVQSFLQYFETTRRTHNEQYAHGKAN